MPYATPSQVFARARGRTFTASTKPNLNDINQYLADTALEIDGILRARGYQVPVPASATAAFQLIAAYNTTGAVALVEQAAPSPSNTAKEALHLWNQCKKMLRDADIELDAPRDRLQALPRHGATATSRFATLTEHGA